MAEGVVVLEPGDDRARKIGRAMANKTAGEILGLLREGEQALSQLSEALEQPITTVKYHVDNLLDAGMIEIVDTRYSEKGRKIKIYGVCEQVVIVSPGKADIQSILMKYASLFGILIFASLAAGIFFQMIPVQVPEMVPMTAGAGDEPTVLRATLTSYSDGAGDLDMGLRWFVLAFFSGGCLVILMLIIYEILLVMRMNRGYP